MTDRKDDQILNQTTPMKFKDIIEEKTTRKEKQEAGRQGIIDPVTIKNIAYGRDTRLSSFLRLAKALKWKIKVVTQSEEIEVTE